VHLFVAKKKAKLLMLITTAFRHISNIDQEQHTCAQLVSGVCGLWISDL
jgi:hypothetical protein